MPSFIRIPIMYGPPREGNPTIPYRLANPALVNTSHIVRAVPSASGPGCRLFLTDAPPDCDTDDAVYTPWTLEQVQAALVNTDDCSIGKP
jgi:hypothetical protein